MKYRCFLCEEWFDEPKELERKQIYAYDFSNRQLISNSMLYHKYDIFLCYDCVKEIIRGRKEW